MMQVTSEVSTMYGFYWVTVTFDGNDKWTLDRGFNTRKEAESSANKWIRKWNSRLVIKESQYDTKHDMGCTGTGQYSDYMRASVVYVG